MMTNDAPSVTLDLSLDNAALYAGCQIETIAGRKNLAEPVENAVSVVGENIHRMVKDFMPGQRSQGIVLTGPMAVWAYLVVFHAVVHVFREVWYDDGRNGPVLVARHG